tara:strand:+ start:7655 stop:8704 length:1050 start_codon:yes stop_codon:yes gene_type:complete
MNKYPYKNESNVLDSLYNILIYIYNIFFTVFSSFNKLQFLNKLFIIFLILLFITILFNTSNNVSNYYLLENYNNIDTNEKYVKKVDTDIYDNFYSKYYDAIHLNKKRNEYELEQIKKLSNKKTTDKILDIGCGTGYTVNIFNDLNYNIEGLDLSEDMISKAQSNYPKCKFILGDILTSNFLDFDAYSHILCLGKTIYEIKEKNIFFENCSSILSKDGFLIIHLVDRNKFKPYVQNKDSDTLYDPEKYGKKVTEMIVKFDNDNEFISKYKIINSDNNNQIDSTITPYASYNEKFSNFKTHNTRENEINLYMPETIKILNLAKSKNFKFLKKIDLQAVDYNNEYLYIFKKI